MAKLGFLFVPTLWVRGSVNFAGIDFIVSSPGSIYTGGTVRAKKLVLKSFALSGLFGAVKAQNGIFSLF